MEDKNIYAVVNNKLCMRRTSESMGRKSNSYFIWRMVWASGICEERMCSVPGSWVNVIAEIDLQCEEYWLLMHE